MALLTQSGAMSITCVERNQQTAVFRTIVSFGNKVDVNIPDLVAYFDRDPKTDVIAIYAEGVGEGEGRQFFNLLRASRKPVIIYKSGRTEAGAKAAASHTAAMSGSYEVFRAACLQGGCILTEELDDFYNYTKAFAVLSKHPARGCRVAGVVNAGLEATMGADILSKLTPATFTPETVEKLRALNTHGLVNVETPFLDLTPMTDDPLYARFIEAVLADPNVDCLFVGIVPHVDTLKTVEENYLDADAIGPLLISAFRKTQKPVIVSVNAGGTIRRWCAIWRRTGCPFSAISAPPFGVWTPLPPTGAAGCPMGDLAFGPGEGAAEGMPVETERLIIRLFEARDIDAFTAYRNDEKWMRFQGFKGLPREQYAQALLKPASASEGVQLAITDKTTGALIGDFYLKTDGERCHIGYTVAPAHARRGYALETVHAMLVWLATQGFQRVYADVMPDNAASIGLLHKAGFVDTGCMEDGDLLYLHQM